MEERREKKRISKHGNDHNNNYLHEEEKIGLGREYIRAILNYANERGESRRA